MGTTFKVAPKDLGKYEKKLKEQFRPTMRAAMETGGRRALAQVQSLSSSQVRPFTGSFSMWWLGQLIDWNAYRVWNSTPYAAPVEYGRRPGAKPPPVRALEPWVEKVLQVAPNRVRSVAFLVAKAIGRRGIKGRNILEQALLFILPTFPKILEAHLDAALRKAR